MRSPTVTRNIHLEIQGQSYINVSVICYGNTDDSLGIERSFCVAIFKSSMSMLFTHEIDPRM